VNAASGFILFELGLEMGSFGVGVLRGEAMGSFGAKVCAAGRFWVRNRSGKFGQHSHQLQDRTKVRVGYG
jgi:hypothetical protein